MTQDVSLPQVRHQGRVDYEPCFRAMQVFTEQRTADTSDELWIVEHPPVFTLGQAGLPSHLLHASAIPLVQTDRGGQITYHGPGQVVIYMLFDLKRRGMMVKEWVRRIEEAIILTLAEYGLHTERHEGAPGIYISGVAGQQHVGAKIAALGLKVKSGCTYHGLSLNVAMDLQPFLDINPCGYAGLETTDMRSMGVKAGFKDVAERLSQHLITQWQATGLNGSPNATVID